MSAVDPSLIPPTAAAIQFSVGVEVNLGAIRAAVFTEGLDLVGKMKLSTKPERGRAAVQERIARCIRYAVDECDIPLGQIASIGVGLPAEIDDDGALMVAPGLGWRQAFVGRELAALLGRPVWTGNAFSLAAWAIQQVETSGRAQSLAAVFPGGILAAGLVIHGRMQSLSSYPEGSPLLPPGSANIIPQAAEDQFRRMRPRDFRRAIRKGQTAPEGFLRGSVIQAARFAATLVRRCPVSRLAMGGGAIDENRDAMFAAFQATLLQELGDETLLKGLDPFVSVLGDMAAVKGAALFATEQQRFGAGGRSSLSGLPSCAWA